MKAAQYLKKGATVRPIAARGHPRLTPVRGVTVKMILSTWSPERNGLLRVVHLCPSRAKDLTNLDVKIANMKAVGDPDVDLLIGFRGARRQLAQVLATDRVLLSAVVWASGSSRRSRT